MIRCTRWTELTDALKFHVDLAASSGTTAEFRFLNNSQPVTISPSNTDVRNILEQLINNNCFQLQLISRSSEVYVDIFLQFLISVQGLLYALHYLGRGSKDL